MQDGETFEQRAASLQQVDFHLPSISLPGTALNQSHLFASIDQRHYTMVFRLQSFGKFADARPLLS